MTFSQLYGGAKFVTVSDLSCTAPYIRGTFEAQSTDNAQIIICGLGVFELYINGRKVSDDMLVPACSLYEKRANLGTVNVIKGEEYTYRVYSMKYDVSEYLVKGKNSLCVLLGRGWYNVPGNYDEGCDIFGDIKLCFKLTQGEDVLLQSDESLKWTYSHILSNDLYLGEVHDYTMYCTDLFDADFDDSAFENVVLCDTPDANYDIQTCPADKVIRTITPKLIHDFGSKKIYDNGENITGFVKMSPAERGAKIRVEHTEELDEKGNLDGASFNWHRRPQIDDYIADGKTEMCPRFTFHGFRYFSVEGDCTPIETLVIHADTPVSSCFECNNQTLNWLYNTFIRTQLTNMHMGIPSDCPTREKLGYTGDGQLLADAVMTVLDCKEFYKKWIQDIADSQDIYTGHVGHTAPVQGGGGGIGGWGSAIIEVPYMYYKHYEDENTLKKYFPNMVRFIDYMYSRCNAGFITGENEGLWCLGDWGFPDEESKELLSQNYVNTYFFVKCLNRMVEICNILGHSVLAKSYEDRAKQSMAAIQAAYMSPMSYDFCGNVAGGNVFAIDLGLGKRNTLENTVKKYSESLKLDTGIFATDLLIKVLFERGYGQLAFDLLTSHVPKYSFGYMMDMGATTLWEYTTGEASHNHPMFGACVKHMFTYLVGIQQKSNAYKEVVISPCDIEGLDTLQGAIVVPCGRISVGYTKKDGKTSYKVIIPSGVNAVFQKNGETRELKTGLNNFVI